MASLLFEGGDGYLKVSTVDKETLEVNISMENELQDVQHAYIGLNLSLEELQLLSRWIDNQISEIRELQKKKINTD